MERSVVEVAVEERVIKPTCWRAGARLGRVCSKTFGDRDACFDQEHVVISVLVTGILHSSGSIAGPLPLCICKHIGRKGSCGIIVSACASSEEGGVCTVKRMIVLRLSWTLRYTWVSSEPFNVFRKLRLLVSWSCNPRTTS
jgi:hypothetical protein